MGVITGRSVSPNPQVDAILRVELLLGGTTWFSLDDVIVSEELQFNRGIMGTSPKDCVAGVGTFVFAMRNDAGNSFGLRGAYSPGHINDQGLLVRGRQLRIVFDFDGQTFIVWSGRLSDIEPTQGEQGEQRTHCRVESMTAGSLKRIKEVAPQLDQTEAQLLQTIFNALPVDSRPTSLILNTAMDVFPYAFDDIGDGVAALTMIKNVTQSAQGYYHETGAGSHFYQNRQTRTFETPLYTFLGPQLTDFKRPTNLDNVFNRFKIWTHDKKISAGNTEILFTYAGRMSILPGEFVEMFIGYQDPANAGFKMGGRDFQPFTANVDYIFNSAENGSGSNVTASITPVVAFFASTAKVKLTNTGGVTAHKITLQGRGRSIIDISPVSSEAYIPQPYGEREIELDFRYQDDPRVAYLAAEQLVAQYDDQNDQIDYIEFCGNRDPSLMMLALTVETGRIVRVSEPQTGTLGISGFVQNISWRVLEGRLVWCRLALSPRIETEVTEADVVQLSDTFDSNSTAPERRIGVGRIGYSEIG